jgi:hypothetical protein
MADSRYRLELRNLVSFQWLSQEQIELGLARRCDVLSRLL